MSPNGPGTDGIPPSVVSPNGPSTDGVSSNVVSPNGPGVTPFKLTGVQPTGVRADGTAIAIAQLTAPWTGASIVGSRWTANVSNGTTITLRLDDAISGLAINADLWSYRVSALRDGVWLPLCPDADGAPGLADTVHGSWNVATGVTGGGAYDPASATFTVACRGSSIAKCVELGFTSWTNHQEELAACVRALRGDYCGDGTSYTHEGTMVNLYDQSGILADGLDWTAEAEWSSDGALCVSTKKAARFSQAAHGKPSCFPRTLKPVASCGREFDDNASIITELAPQ